jgi:hypothetical protein
VTTGAGGGVVGAGAGGGVLAAGGITTTFGFAAVDVGDNVTGSSVGMISVGKAFGVPTAAVPTKVASPLLPQLTTVSTAAAAPTAAIPRMIVTCGSSHVRQCRAVDFQEMVSDVLVLGSGQIRRRPADPARG